MCSVLFWSLQCLKKKTRYIGFTITSCVVTTLLNNLQIIYQYLMTSFSKTNHYHSYISFLLFVCFYLYVSIHKYDIKPCLPDMTIWVKGGVSYKTEAGTAHPFVSTWFHPGLLLWVRCCSHISFLCCIVFMWFTCLRPMFLDCQSRFSLTFIHHGRLITWGKIKIPS